MTRGPRRCTWCKSTEHTDRYVRGVGGPDRVAVCPGRRAWMQEREREEANRVAMHPCEMCGDEAVTTELIITPEKSVNVGPACRQMLVQLATLLGGTPGPVSSRRQNAPSLRVVK